MVERSAAMAAVAAEMDRLRQAYFARLPAEIDELSELVEALVGSPADTPALEALRQRLHRLAGSGGTFGLGTLGARARELELRVHAWLADAAAATDAASRADLAAGVRAMREMLDEGCATLAAALPDAGPVASTGEAVHVWLVEDDVLLGQELERLLKQFGFAVSRFTQLADAEAATRSAQPDILILDVLFAEERENATEFMTLQPGLRSVGCPLIFVSSHGDFASRVRAARLGAEGYMQKPIDVPRLVDRIEKILEKRRSPPQRVLIVDDDRDLAAHFRLVLLGAGMAVEVLDRPEAVVEALMEFRPELVLMDMHMPGYSGTDLAGVIRQYDNWISLPIVYLSAETDFDKQLQALGQGADDFLTKPISDAQLVAAVRVRVARSRQLADQISKDSLTGLLKHASIKEAAELEVVRARRSGKPVSLAMVDIDHFKKVNDTHGHAVGDLVIKSIATLLRQRLRKSDLIGRYGGEEFVAVLPECDTGAAERILEDIRLRFASLHFTHEGQTFECTLSAGLVCSVSHPELDAAELLVLADQALYAAKRCGRNQVRSSETLRDPVPG